MSPPAATESAFAGRLRHLFRAYRYAPFSPAHGLIRRVFRGLIGQHQRIRLRNGVRLDIDLASEVQQALFWLDGDYEPQLEWALRELMPVGSTFVDCGANCGYAGLLARRHREAPVWFVEPHPRLAETVRRNLALNGWADSGRVVEAAASDQKGEAILYEHPQKDGSHSLLPGWSHAPAAGAATELKVRMDTLPALLGDLPELAHIGFLKVDAEGHDFAVLKGLGAWLNPARVGLIYTELGEEREAGFALLDRAGFTGFVQPPRRPRQLRRCLQRHHDGQPVAIFEPLDPARPSDADTLWLPKGGAAARHLTTLSRWAC